MQAHRVVAEVVQLKHQIKLIGCRILPQLSFFIVMMGKRFFAIVFECRGNYQLPMSG
jgi:hypothetical protein